LYYLDNNEYPIDGCTVAGESLGCGCLSFDGMVAGELLPGGYISIVPEDPTDPDPCYQYQRNYIGFLCGGQALSAENYVVLFRSETDIVDGYRDWLGGTVPGAYSCLSSF
jgi:hypothetical protein